MSWEPKSIPIHKCAVCGRGVENDNYLGLDLMNPLKHDMMYFCTRHGLRIAMAIAETYPQIAGMFGNAEMREHILRMLDETEE